MHHTLILVSFTKETFLENCFFDDKIYEYYPLNAKLKKIYYLTNKVKKIYLNFKVFALNMMH